jgi:hypothetical protein
LKANKIGSHCGKSIDLSTHRLIFNRQVAAFNPTDFAQALAKRTQKVRYGVSRWGAEEPNQPHRRLLPARREGQRCRRAAEQRHELAS